MNTADTIKNTLGVGSAAKRSGKKWIGVGVFVSLLLIGGGSYLFWGDSEEAVRYETDLAERKTLVTRVSATGNLEPTNSVDVGIEVSGTIEEVLVDFNDRVRIGDVMARLDTTRLSASVESSKAALLRYEANVAEAKASLVFAQNEWERVNRMYAATGGNYPSKKELDEALASFERAKAQLDAALAQAKQARDELASNQYNLDRAVVVSPINGIVLSRKVEPGQTVVASMQTPVLFTMAEDLTKMRVILSVDEADIGEVRENQEVEFTVDAYPERTFNGVITQLRLNSEIVNGVVTYDTVVSVDNTDLLLRPGMTVSAHIATDVLENVLTVPNAALRFIPAAQAKSGESKTKRDPKTPSVWVLRQNRPVQVAVRTGKSDGVSTVVTDTQVQEGDSVLVGIQKP